MPPRIEITTKNPIGDETSIVGNKEVTVTMEQNKIIIDIPNEIGVKSVKKSNLNKLKSIIEEDSRFSSKETGQDIVNEFYDRSQLSPAEKIIAKGLDQSTTEP